MIAHMKELAARIAGSIAGRVQEPVIDLLSAFLEAVNALDPQGFAPDVRADFLYKKAQLNRRIASRENPVASSDAAQIAAMLDSYGPLAQPPTRLFRWLSDPDLRTIVERDYIEVSKLTLPSGAWKSTVIMAGSITEAILFDLLTKDAGRYAMAQASQKVPTKTPQGGQPTKLPAGKWTLENLIAIATDIRLIPAARAATFDQVLRDYRNFVHPAKEVRAEHPCREGEALMAKGALDALCDHFDHNL